MKIVTNKYIQVIEHEQITKDIGEKYFKELESFAQNTNLLSYAKKGELKANQYVGIIQTKSGFVLEILPKIAKNSDIEKSKEILLKMLKTLKKSPFYRLNLSTLKTEKFPLLEIFIRMYINELDSLIKIGIKSEYIAQSDNLNFLRGKLKIDSHITKNIAHKEKFYIEYDEFLSNRVENKIIKTTLLKLNSLSKNFQNQRRIRELIFILDEIDIIYDYKSVFEKVKIDRSLKHYKITLNLSKIFLLNKSFTPFKDKDIAFTLLFDMNILFESYVGDLFKRRYNNIYLQKSLGSLFENKNRFKLVPDILSKDIVFDTKWKIVEKEKDISKNDIYQMYAYAANANVAKAVLIYPKIYNINIETFKFNQCGKKKKMHIYFLDLTK